MVSFFAIISYFDSMDFISPVYARLVLRELERREIDPAPLFAETLVDRHHLLHGGDIAMEDFLRILRTGDELLGEEPLGLVLGRELHVLAMGPVGTALASAPNLRAGLQALESFTRLHATYVDIDARSTLQGITVRILYQHDTGDVERFHTQTAMLMLQQYVEILTGEPIDGVRFRMTIPEPDDTAVYTSLLHGETRFAAHANELDIPHRWLDPPSPYFHPELWRQAKHSLSRDLKSLVETEDATFRNHIAGLLRTSEPPLPDLAYVASDLNVSQRTLNRRLQAENTSFRQLKSEAMARWAKQYLRETDHSVEAIAEALGYRDTANFRRAFRKTVGCSPVDYRSGALN
ncbi:MAG: AraC family transcriptional regulator ligand-binding domain-containing protein [Woeseiaceae bacterium]|nr:AraC family transcriptional regulator ligand-binding domain-containing protein [Woeseiaceae bacterium]